MRIYARFRISAWFWSLYLIHLQVLYCAYSAKVQVVKVQDGPLPLDRCCAASRTGVVVLSDSLRIFLASAFQCRGVLFGIHQN